MLTYDELVKASGAEVLSCKNSSGLFNICTDSRNIKPDTVYLPLKGEKFDGNEFIKSAVEQGAKGYFTENRNILCPEANFALFVPNALEAYLEIASFRKQKIAPITIAITGSSGKTTTKEMMASVAKKAFKTHKSELNHNNEVGLCQTLLSMPKDTEVLVVEMGMRGLGEIELLSKYAKPDIAIIANTGTAHIGRLGSVENIAKAKCEITKYLHPEGILFAHDTNLIKKVNDYAGETFYVGLKSPDLKDIELYQNKSEFTYRNHKYKLNVEGEHNIQNALFVINAALKLGMKPDLIAQGLEEYKPIENRWQVEEISGYKIVNDSYNSNPESLKAAASTFLMTQKAPRLLVLGDMKELGECEEEFHKNCGDFLNKFEDFELVTVGELAKHIAEGLNPKKGIKTNSFATNSQAAKYILENISDGTTILFKASRSMKFEEIIKELRG